MTAKPETMECNQCQHCFPRNQSQDFNSADVPKPVIEINAADFSDLPWVADCVERYPQNCDFPGVDVLFLTTIFSMAPDFFKLNMRIARNNKEITEGLSNKTIDVLLTLVGASITQTFYESRSMFVIRRGPPIVMIVNSKNYISWMTLFLVSISCVIVKQTWNRLSKDESLRISRGIGKGSRYLYGMGLVIFLNLFSSALAIMLSRSSAPPNPFNNMAELSQLLATKQCRALIQKATNYNGSQILEVNDSEA